MAKVQLIRRRIKSVKNIKQITKAMEMVAASKLRRAQEATLRSRAYAVSAREALARLRLVTDESQHPLFAQREVRSQLIIVFSSDRGLAGAYNSNLFKGLLQQLTPALATKLIVVGQKGGQFVSRLKEGVEVLGVYPNWPASPTTQDIRPIARAATEAFLSGSVDRVQVLFTDYISSIRRVVTARTILPVNPAEILNGDGALTNVADFLFEPTPARVLNYIVPRFVEVQIYQANFEAIASEQSMRMLAMKSASDNAEDITRDLVLTFNGARQASITQELAEITPGAEAIK